MKFTKPQIKKLLLIELSEPDSALLKAIGDLTQKINDLDVSIDYLAGAVTGDSPAAIGYAQGALGRFGRTGISKPYPLNSPQRMDEVVEAIVQELRAMTNEEMAEALGPDADVGDYIEDFKDSDAPQFKGKSKKKRREMAIAAALSAKDEK